MKDRITFKYVVDGNEVEFAVKQPSFKDIREAKKIYNSAFSDALKSGAILREKLNTVLENQGIWNAEKQSKYTSLNGELIDGIKRLEKGGIKLSAAKELALRLITIREDIRDLVAERGQLDNLTAQGQADNARFQYLVSTNLVYNTTGKPYYKDYEDFVQRCEEPLAYIASQHLMNLQYNYEDEGSEALPEYKFLKQFKFVDDKLRLINKDGHLVDEDGRLINEEGRYIDSNGNFVDKDGDRVDIEGKSVFEFQGFIDDETNEVVGLDKEEEVEETEEVEQEELAPITSSSASSE